MQIHELNNFNGTLGSGAYLAIDGGTDTGKISTQQLLAPTEARIDNIIAGDAPSAAEVTDARLGADGVTYTSLGTAIRAQVSDLKASSINSLNVLLSADDLNLMNKIDVLMSRVWSNSGGVISQGASVNTRACSSIILTFDEVVASIVLDGYAVGIMKIDTNGQTVLYDSGWITQSTEYLFEAGYYYSFNFRKINETAIPSTSDVKDHIDILAEPYIKRHDTHYGTLVFADGISLIDRMNIISKRGWQNVSGQISIWSTADRACAYPYLQVGTVKAHIVTNGFKVGIMKVANDKVTVLGDSGWLLNGSDYTLEDGCYYVLNFAKTSGGTIASYTEVKDNVQILVDPYYKGVNKLIDTVLCGEALPIKDRIDFRYGKYWSNDGGQISVKDSLARVSSATPIKFGNVNAQIIPKNGYRVGVTALASDQVTVVGDSGWLDSEIGYTFSEKYYYVFNFKNPNEDATITPALVKQNFDLNAFPLLNDSDAIINSVDVEYGRINGETSYYFLRIPKNDIKGRMVTPKVAITSADGSVAGTKVSALTFAKRENTSVVINASLFNTSTMKPEGQLVIDGVDMTTYKTDSSTGDQYAWMDNDMGSPISDKECYPLLIDANGDLSCYSSEDRTASENQPSAIISAGYKYAVTAWGMIVNNFTDDDLQHDEIVHSTKYIRQAIGQYQNGDYFVFSCDKTGYGGINAPTSHEAGVTYSDLAAFLIGKGVKFAYSLDGGGSCETVLGNRQVNPIFDGTVGRSVPTVIYWSAD